MTPYEVIQQDKAPCRNEQGAESTEPIFYCTTSWNVVCRVTAFPLTVDAPWTVIV
jgi:hypothetical protein